MKRILFFCLFLTFSHAQTDTTWFSGEWTATARGHTFTLVNNADGSYRFSGGGQSENGTWTLVGNTLTQIWHDLNTGETTSVTYALEKLSENTFTVAGGNFGATILSFTKVNHTTNPLTTRDTAINPLTLGTSDNAVTKAWLEGEWLVNVGGVFISKIYKADGTYTLDATTLKGQSVYKESGTWTVANSVLTESWNDSSTQQPVTSSYELERVSDISFRVIGGNNGLQSLLFLKQGTIGAVTPRSAWLVGVWETTYDIYTFYPNGSYLVVDYFDSSQQRRGQWRLDADQLMLTGDVNASYTLTINNGLVYLAGVGLENYNEFGHPFNPVRNGEGPFNPFLPLTFTGQYIGNNSTLTITGNGGSWLQNGVTHTLQNIQTKGDFISFTAVAPNGTQKVWTLQLVENGLIHFEKYGRSVTIDYALQKVSETTLTTVNDLASFWTGTLEPNVGATLFLLDDGRYRETLEYSTNAGPEIYTTDGRYSFQNNALTLDPECDEPTNYAAMQTVNQLLLSYQQFGESHTNTFFAPTPTTLEYQLTQDATRQARLETENQSWLQKIPTGLVDNSTVTNPLGSETTPDENSNDYFVGATVFTNLEVYPYTSDYYMAYLKDGTFIQTSTGLQVSQSWDFPGSFPFKEPEDIVSERGTYHDSHTIYFFPNGRTFIYSESYTNALETTFPPTPRIHQTWGKYKIENSNVIIETDEDEKLLYELLYGNRKLRVGEACYHNTKVAQ